MFQEQEVERDRPESFEQHLHGTLRADALVSGGASPQDRYWPHLSDKDRRYIEGAAQEFARLGLRPGTVTNYARALRRLGNHLGEQGQTILESSTVF